MPIVGAVLDHVAVAAESWSQAWPRYVAGLGGEWASGGLGVGFAPSQLGFANGARLEVLQPWRTDENPFLRRFLDANGPGPHHLTFKVPDIESALDEARRAGIEPVSIDLSDPGWLEAFLHPRQAAGVVVQLAQASGSWESPPPEGFPTERPAVPAALIHVTHTVADLDAGLALFERLLGGELEWVETDEAGSWRCASLRWSGPLGVRLVAPVADAASPLSEWLAGRSGRVHHLAFSQPSGSTVAPAAPGPAVPGVLRGEGPASVVEPADNLGTRVVVTPHAPSARGGAGQGTR